MPGAAVKGAPAIGSSSLSMVDLPGSWFGASVPGVEAGVYRGSVATKLTEEMKTPTWTTVSVVRVRAGVTSTVQMTARAVVVTMRRQLAVSVTAMILPCLTWVMFGRATASLLVLLFGAARRSEAAPGANYRLHRLSGREHR